MRKRKYSREFKVSAVKLVNEQGYSIVDAAKSLGIDPANVRNWLEKYGPEAQPAPSTEASLRAEVRRLRRENAELVIERDILKKAAAYFAREQP
jgi:transposase